ncbi:hypothetical protein OMP38_10935 [Cohnella ginsengisoli]|uniref:Uncharacterized protein n=1 Tax=Cohnella ginsengisoli TaxID=425004 RepID=A0A9X4QMH0_9BACL|nr:hypothetical protein [Cohnella ginsengisoli]MDG0791331.1 hypothetical protein [Cohnella ginsengisoli]
MDVKSIALFEFSVLLFFAMIYSSPSYIVGEGGGVLKWFLGFIQFRITHPSATLPVTSTETAADRLTGCRDARSAIVSRKRCVSAQLLGANMFIPLNTKCKMLLIGKKQIISFCFLSFSF